MERLVIQTQQISALTESARSVNQFINILHEIVKSEIVEVYSSFGMVTRLDTIINVN